MAVPPEAFDIAVAAIALTVIALYYLIHKKLKTWLFTFGFICSAAMAVSLLASLVAAPIPPARAVADIGVLLAGCAAFVSSAWLCFVFKMAGEPDGG
ncbi:MAG: hypothetical protein A4E28_03033 [Methanocella sp. PtaU1.Bin125]|nr:MAG: hypothetical protein A4E28_03033 [Methanocella sp. PtaU1.Bin125]